MKITLHANSPKYWRWSIYNPRVPEHGNMNTYIYFAFFLIIISR